MKSVLVLATLAIFATSCGSFKAERVDANKSDEKALSITDNWMSADTTQAVADVIKQMKAHPGFNKMKAKYGTPKVFIAEVQNQTSEAYFPIGDMNDEFLNELSLSGEFELVDQAAR